ncbi:MAG TPA: type II toxin-antitoxin system RelE/ParE family toxin [Desulfuromonadales bacterium]|nr:type II toxin-antitoxin system RelE/ParE family toxin [Desulfuromonadales bacterium]
MQLATMRRQALGLDADFLTKIEIALQDISEAPERWPVVRNNIRRQLIQRFPYSLLYRIDPDEINVLAVMHQKRHPSYLLPRRGLN